MKRKESCYKDISGKLGWKNPKETAKQAPPIDLSKQNPPIKPKTTVKPKSTGNGNEI